jgi:hypothetical protein
MLFRFHDVPVQLLIHFLSVLDRAFEWAPPDLVDINNTMTTRDTATRRHRTHKCRRPPSRGLVEYSTPVVQSTTSPAPRRAADPVRVPRVRHLGPTSTTRSPSSRLAHLRTAPRTRLRLWLLAPATPPSPSGTNPTQPNALLLASLPFPLPTN